MLKKFLKTSKTIKKRLKRKKVARIKKQKKTFFYIYGIHYVA